MLWNVETVKFGSDIKTPKIDLLKEELAKTLNIRAHKEPLQLLLNIQDVLQE